ncbi:DUF4199 domain-containing protein [Polluticaenibacter yanchengensis]|uniref:DUF4199 domain-containing protein n=1 Tax=Polluticaenibacter yanchengensis TaxID=3014562 RepID=A0ABT4UG51_9BACT|nr:DUF4199 domain-containing protein [Chitinophagaceae bacterium LY-5]
MQKNILVHGLIAGIIVSVIMLFSMNYYSHCQGNIDWNTSMLVGYASMLIAFSMVFVGIRNYRNKFNNGVISFKKAFQIGILITLIASTIYVLSWLVFYFYFIPDFMDKYGVQEIQNMKTSGATVAEIESKTKEIAAFSKMYKNPFFNALMTYAEILPVGLIVTLISAFILKRKAAQVP